MQCKFFAPDTVQLIGSFPWLKVASGILVIGFVMAVTSISLRAVRNKTERVHFNNQQNIYNLL